MEQCPNEEKVNRAVEIAKYCLPSIVAHIENEDFISPEKHYVKNDGPIYFKIVRGIGSRKFSVVFRLIIKVEQFDDVIE